MTLIRGSAVLLMAALLAGELHAQCPDGTPPPCPGPAAPARSVAVLTFENVTGDSAAQYLAEGLADQIFTRLAQLERLTVISRSAVRRLRNANRLSVQDAGRSLRAAYLVSGSIRSSGGRLRINVEALRASTGAAIWSNAYDRPPDDLLGLEEAIASEVAAGIAGRLTPQEQRGLARTVTASAAAYARLLRGNAMLARRTVPSIEAAIADYRAAAEADPRMVEAPARLAYAYAWCVLNQCGGDSVLEKSRAAAVRAIALDPASSDAWMGRAYQLYIQSRGVSESSADSLSASYAAFRRSVTLDPRNAEAWHQYGASLTGVSDSAAEAALRRALAIDPTRAISYSDLALVYATTRRPVRALAVIDSAMALDSASFIYVFNRLFILLETGDTAGAVAFARSRDLGGMADVMTAAFAGDSAARSRVEASISAGTAGSTLFVLPEYYMWTGRLEAAAEGQLQRTRALGFPWFWLRRPLYDTIRGDPRIAAYLAGVHRDLAGVRWR